MIDLMLAVLLWPDQNARLAVRIRLTIRVSDPVAVLENLCNRPNSDWSAHYRQAPAHCSKNR